MSVISDRALNLSESSTLKMARLARELKESGKDVISLSLGEPDFFTPDFIKDAAKKAIDENYSLYTPVPGYKDLQVAICEKLKRDNGLNYAPENIVVSTGAKQSIMNVILATVNPGDEVILPAPYWVSYIEMVRFAGGVPVVIETGIESDFKVSKKELEDAITNKTKLFLFSNPCNPSGTVYSKAELTELASVFSKNKNIYIVSDEIYELINFYEKNVSFASFSDLFDRVITVNGVSKGFAMTGWRVGYIAAPKEIAAASSKIQGQFTSGTCSIAQRAALAAMKADPSVVDFMKEKFESRKNLMVKKLSEISGLKVNNPQGAFYIFPDISSAFGKTIDGESITDSEKFCLLLLEKALVAATPGVSFGSPNNVRFSYATSEAELEKACERISEFFKKLC